MINDLYNRGVSEPLLFIADGIPKLDEEIRKVFPRTDFQLCTIHASRNFESEVRESDKITIDRELKRVFTADTKEDALAPSPPYPSSGRRRVHLKIWRCSGIQEPCSGISSPPP